MVLSNLRRDRDLIDTLNGASEKFNSDTVSLDLEIQNVPASKFSDEPYLS